MLIKTLPVKLTPDEERSKGKEAARIGRECTTMHLEMAQLKIAMKQKKEALADKARAIVDLHHEINTGQEYREVQCREELDHTHLVVHTIRLDTGEVIETRAMTLDERQVTLPFAVREH
jgi:hypothetical protein